MLTQLSIKNFAVVKHIELDLREGLSAITGETGAGKSIGIDALALCIGARAEASMVRSGAEKAEIIAHFDVSQLPTAQQWLTEFELDSDDECFIRRVVSKEGRSKAFINGSPVGLQQLKQLGSLLISIHGQNAHQQLLKTSVQRQLLDDFGGHESLLNNVRDSYQHYQNAQKRFSELTQEAQSRDDRKHLLSYQVNELDEFGLAEDEFSALETEHKRLSNSQSLLEESQLSFHRLYDDEQFNALSAIQQSADSLSSLCDSDAQLVPIVTMLNEAAIQVDEAARELRQYCDDLDIDPLRLQQVENRFDKANELARKHHVLPEHLYAKHMELVEELTVIEQASSELAHIEQELTNLKSAYLDDCSKLTEARQKAAKVLAKRVEAQVQRMNMPHSVLTIEVNPTTDKFSSQGLDEVRFLIATNIGQNADTLEKVVSGGELARVGLALHVIATNNGVPPTLIFDEVDTGISGPTASIVGQLLRQMGAKAQVLCVTHLPQVAAQAHNQLFVTKKIENSATETHIIELDKKARVNELARLLAGDEVTDSAISNAESLLAAVA